MLKIVAILFSLLVLVSCSDDDAAKQFGACEMQVIEKMEYRQGDWDGPAGRYLYACMRAAGYDLKSHKTPAEGYCTQWDMKRIVLPECYKPTTGILATLQAWADSAKQSQQKQ